MIILVMGPQGSGKSTQGKLLAEKYQLEFLSMGQILRDLEAVGDPLGVKAATHLVQGALVPDELFKEIIQQYFQSHEFKQGFVLDGFPRHMEQYRWVDEIFPEPISAVVYIHLDRSEILRRLRKRREIESRKDDTDEVIEKRLSSYFAHTVPVIEKIQQDGVEFIEVDGTPSIEEIHQEIMQRLGELLPAQNGTGGE